MPKQRQYAGDETTEALSNWKKDQKAAERLAASILHINDFTDVDPSHPMGGPDDKKDILCKKENQLYVVAVHFPRTPQSFIGISKKIREDFSGVREINAVGFIIFTNQHLTVGERNKLQKSCPDTIVEIYHLERIASILNSPVGYGIRLEFLDILLSKEEQLAYFAYKDKELAGIRNSLSDLLKALNESNNIPNIPADKLNSFKETLEAIVTDKNAIYVYGNSMIDKLHVPLKELKEFQEVLSKMTEPGSWVYSQYNIPMLDKLNVPLGDLQDFQGLLCEIVGEHPSDDSPIKHLYVPLSDLQQYNDILDETLDKLEKIKKLQAKTKC
jgi:hypothetical protein